MSIRVSASESSRSQLHRIYRYVCIWFSLHSIIFYSKRYYYFLYKNKHNMILLYCSTTLTRNCWYMLVWMFLSYWYNIVPATMSYDCWIMTVNTIIMCLVLYCLILYNNYKMQRFRRWPSVSVKATYWTYRKSSAEEY